MPVIVAGRPLEQLPLDLYIPPDALSVLLSQFEGPLDLLLYLIRKQNIDILAIPVAEVTRQYLAYLSIMQTLHQALAAEYLLMAAWLAEIKSRLLLPSPPKEEDEDETEDPRSALVARLLAYEQLNHAARWLDEQPRVDRDYFTLTLKADLPRNLILPAQLTLPHLVAALRAMVSQGELNVAHEIRQETLSVRARMRDILDLLNAAEPIITLDQIYQVKEGRGGVAVSVVALLELARADAIDFWQETPFSSIRLSAPQ
jgi:segregation and condensation protein A